MSWLMLSPTSFPGPSHQSNLLGRNYRSRVLVSRNGDKTKPGFLVCDVAPHVDYGAVDYFLHKVRTHSAFPKNRPLLPIFVALGFTPEALRKLKGAGVVATTPTNIFGTEIGQALRALMEVLTNAAVALRDRGEQVFELFDKLSKIEGAALNLRGALFEFIVAAVERAQHRPEMLEMGRVVRSRDYGNFEIDVEARIRRTVRFYECKGKAPGGTTSRIEVETWLGKLGRIRSWALEEYRGVDDVTFEIWTSGRFEDDALELLRARQEATKKYNIAYMDGPSISGLLRDAELGRVRHLFNEHFAHHPLAAIS